MNRIEFISMKIQKRIRAMVDRSGERTYIRWLEMTGMSVSDARMVFTAIKYITNHLHALLNELSLHEKGLLLNFSDEEDQILRIKIIRNKIEELYCWVMKNEGPNILWMPDEEDLDTMQNSLVEVGEIAFDNGVTLQDAYEEVVDLGDDPEKTHHAL